ncbi:MAG: hypothetical protein IKO76_06980 [Butyrivibrio sp.]|nr:hypothetical protein [Butyrivibrio sp.]
MSDKMEEKRYSWTGNKQTDKMEESEFVLMEKGKKLFEGSGNDPLLSEDDTEAVDALAEVRKKVEKKMPKKFEFTNRGEMLEKGEYLYKDGSKSKKAKRQVRDKSSMKNVVDTLKVLDNILSLELDLKEEDRLRDAFLDVCLACETYINKKNPYTAEGKARKQMVQDFYDQVSWESMRFQQILEGYKGHEDELAGRKWIDVLADARVEVYENGKDGVEIEMGGAGTSDVFVIEKNGEKKYFKESETIPEKELAVLFQQKYSAFKNEKIEGDTEVERTINQKIHDRRMLLVTCTQRAINMNFISPENIKEKFSKCFNKQKMLELLKRIDPTLFVDEDKGEQYNVTEEEEKEDFDFLATYYFGIRKNYMLASIATGNAKIDENETLTKRNAAASRLAKILGIEDVIVKSKMVDLLIDGKKKRGVLMDEAKGNTLSAYRKELDVHSPEAKVRYTAEALKQISQLQILDIICGQVDRNDSNYICDIVENDEGIHDIKKIQGIDNDMAFGKLKYKDIFARGENGYNRIKNIEDEGSFMGLAIDLTFAKKIVRLKPEILDYQMCDLLNKKEREALIDRLRGVQNALIRRMKLEQDNNVPVKKSVFLETNEEWEMRKKQLTEIVEKADDKIKNLSNYSYMKVFLLGDLGAKNPAFMKKFNLKK